MVYNFNIIYSSLGHKSMLFMKYIAIRSSCLSNESNIQSGENHRTSIYSALYASPEYHSTLKATYTTLTIRGFSYLMLNLPPPTYLFQRIN